MTRFDQPSNLLENSFAALQCVEAARSATTSLSYFGLRRAAVEMISSGITSSAACDALNSLKMPLESFEGDTRADLVTLAVTAAAAPFREDTIELYLDALWHCATEEMGIIEEAIEALRDPLRFNLTDQEREIATECLTEVLNDYMELEAEEV